jgi:outer membrane cobalamin receptor
MANLSAFEAIRLLRPRWLQSRGTSNIRGAQGGRTYPVVMVDGSRSGSGTLEDLRQITVEDVESIRFIPGRDATTLYGTGYGGGIIEVTTRRR